MASSKYTISTVFSGVDRMTSPISKMQRSMHRFTSSADRGLRKVNHMLNRTLGNLTKRTIQASIGFLGLSVGGLAVSLHEVANKADELSKSAARLNFPIEELQKWNFIAEQSGLSVDELNVGINMLARNVGDAKRGMGTLNSQFKKADPAFLKQIKNTKNTSQALELMIKKIRDTKDPTEQASLAMQVFGRSGIKMVNIAKTSSSALNALKKEAEDNFLITQQQATAAEALNDALNSLKRAFTGLLAQALLPIMPMLTNYIRQLREWAIANKDIITADIKKFMDDLIKGIKWLKDNGDTVLKVTKWVFGLVIAIKTLSVVMTALNIIMSLNPIGLIVLGVAALAAGLAVLIIKFKSVREWFKKLYDDVKNGIDFFVSGFKKVADTVGKIANPMQKLAPASAGAQPNLKLGMPTLLDALKKPQPNIITPQQRTADAISTKNEEITRAEVTLKDETKGKAVITKGKLGNGLKLQKSGAF